jgi:FKBP-type peptidyl-prolyl cis-trans isomerase FklB
MKLQNEKLEVNLKAGEEFLKINKHKARCCGIAQRLQYEILKKRFGAKPTAARYSTMSYHCTLINGTVFDSSVERGCACRIWRFTGDSWLGVSPSAEWRWVSKWRIVYPSALAYGLMVPAK